MFESLSGVPLSRNDFFLPFNNSSVADFSSEILSVHKQRQSQANSFLLLLLRAGEPLVQELLAVVDLPAVHLYSDDDHEVHDRHGGEAEDESVGFAVPIELLRHGEHLHTAVDQRGHAEEPGTDHGDHQIADVVARQGHEAEGCGNYAEEVRVLPLVRRGHHLVGHQAQLAHCHLTKEGQSGQSVEMSTNVKG